MSYNITDLYHSFGFSAFQVRGEQAKETRQDGCQKPNALPEVQLPRGNPEAAVQAVQPCKAFLRRRRFLHMHVRLHQKTVCYSNHSHAFGDSVFV